MGAGTKAKNLVTGIWSGGQRGYRDYAAQGVNAAFEMGGAYAGGAASAMIQGTGGYKRWGTAGGAALGMGYGAFSDNGSVIGSGLGGAAIGGLAGGLAKGASNAASTFLKRNPQT